ncbi:unnamed protein product [Closterium sp. Naga37s-1]|nr:unnamed protein product [Closterium sp. Naga37s-1]
MLGLKRQAEEPSQALRRSRTDNTLLLLEAGETGHEAEGSERQGRDGEEPGDAAAGEAQPEEPRPEETANERETEEVPHLQAPEVEEPQKEARGMTAPRVTLMGQEGVATPRETTRRGLITVAETMGERQTAGTTALRPGDGDRASEARARRSPAGQQEDAEAGATTE